MSAPRKPAYPRTFPGLIGAMIIVVLAVFAFVVFRDTFRDNEPTPIQAVEWKPWIKAAGQEGRIAVIAPAALPKGWIAREARYGAGSLHVALLTDEKRYVGLEEADESLKNLVEQYVDADATPGKPVTIGGVTWQTWTDSGGDYALGRSTDGRAATSYLVVGSADEQEIRDFAASLK